MGAKRRKKKKTAPSGAAPREQLPFWSPEHLRSMSTQEIIDRLASMGIVISEAQFVDEAESLNSAEKLADAWWQRFDCTAEGQDEGFPWMAALVLWERLLPDSPCLEMIYNLIEGGYDIWEEGREAEVADRWLKAWEMLKTRLTPEMTRLQDADKMFEPFLIEISQWCLDLDDVLGSDSLQSADYQERRLRFCRDVCAQFIDDDVSILGTFGISEAVALWKLGRHAEAERRFEELIQRYPDHVWAYVAWANCLWLWVDEKPGPETYERASRIYLLALSNPYIKEHDALLIYQSLAELWSSCGDEEQAEYYEKRCDAVVAEFESRLFPDRPSFDDWSSPAPPSELSDVGPRDTAPWVPPPPQQPFIRTMKLGRNDPCWCGSGKKYKKCHLDSDQESGHQTAEE